MGEPESPSAPSAPVSPAPAGREVPAEAAGMSHDLTTDSLADIS